MFRKIACLAFFLVLVGCGDKNDIDQKTLVDGFPHYVRSFFEIKEIKLDKTNQEGNYAIYNTTGQLMTKSPLFEEVISIGDKIVYQESMSKGTVLSFSSTLQAQGSQQSGWKLRYGHFILDKEIDDLMPLSKVNTQHALFIHDKNFKFQIHQLEARYQLYQEHYPELVKQRDALKVQLIELQQQVNQITKSLNTQVNEEKQALRMRLNEYWVKNRSAQIVLNNQQNKALIDFNINSGKALQPLFDKRALLARANTMIVDGKRVKLPLDEANQRIAELDADINRIKARQKAEKDNLLAHFKSTLIQSEETLKVPTQQMEAEYQQKIDNITLKLNGLLESAQSKIMAFQTQLDEVNAQISAIERFTQGFNEALSYLKSKNYY